MEYLSNLRFYGLYGYLVGPEVVDIVKIPACFIFSMKIFTENLLFQIPFHHRSVREILAAVLLLDYMIGNFSQSVCRFSKIRSQHIVVLSTNVKILYSIQNLTQVIFLHSVKGFQARFIYFVRKRIKRVVLELWGYATEKRVFSRPCFGNPKHRFQVDLESPFHVNQKCALVNINMKPIGKYENL